MEKQIQTKVYGQPNTLKYNSAGPLFPRYGMRTKEFRFGIFTGEPLWLPKFGDFNWRKKCTGCGHVKTWKAQHGNDGAQNRKPSFWTLSTVIFTI